MKKRILKVAMAGLLLTATAALCWPLLPHPGEVHTDNAYVHGEVTQISAEVNGVLTRLHVTDNQQVQAGQLLAEIDDRDYQARLAKAKAGLALCLANLDNLAARTRVQQVRIEENAARLDAAVAEEALQGQELKRYRELVGSGAVSRTHYDQQVSRERQAKAALAAARQQLQGSHQQLATLATEQANLLAQQQQALADIALAELALDDTHIRAPVAGVIADRKVQTGELLKAGAPLFSLVPLDQIWLQANFKETQVTDMRPGQQVKVVLDRLPNQPLAGRIESLAPATGGQFSLIPPSNATGNFVKIVQRVPVRIALTLPKELQGQVVPGLSAEVTVNLDGQ
ncbi:HlyD family secretion protein [Gallaecimonas xiamenensis]|uniref:Uncharacterized protein n=1 Tax=Gallaecimonas xiamenensis 3-C-1 TaxID=745411 RepID=K2ID50_9GAMM|nr:HlyD family secretion protein [Gallaecimonas xiamenensis]EKE67906.1 hypothetical protein B3C1_17732 [Gallaecimonas xiamenensis 3-C-1]